MSDEKYSVLAVASHPVQYMAPVFRRMAKHSRLDLHVAYCSLRGAEAAVDPEFGREVKWDVPLLEGYEWTHVPNKGPEQESFWGMNNPGLKDLIREGKFDAVLCFVGYVRASFWIAFRAARASGAAFLFGTDATSLAPRDGRTWKVAVKKVLWPQLFGFADQILAPSTGTVELMRSLGFSCDQITLVPYTVDNDWWMAEAAKVDREAERKKLGLRETDTAILFCAKLQPWKRPMDLLRAYAEAQREDSLLIFAGDGPLRNDLKAEAARLEISERVLFRGFVNQSALPSLYKSADLMVLPSAYEPFAVVVNEAMCCGCPAMVSDQVGAARDLVEPIAREFVFSAGNVKDIADKLAGVMRTPEKLRALRTAVVGHIKTWSPDRNIEATIDWVERGVARARTRRRKKDSY